MADKSPSPQDPDAPHDPAHDTDPDAYDQAASMSFMALLMAQFSTAWLFLTRVPLPRWWNRPPEVVEEQDATDSGDEDIEAEAQAVRDKGRGMTPLAETVRVWPFVGLLVGAAAGLMMWTGAELGLHPLGAAVVGLAVATLITGALHEDGLADVADGFGGGADKSKKLKIMRDSRIGVYGMLALIFAVGFKAGALAGFTGPGFAAAALIAAHTLARAAMPLVMVTLTPVRRTGLGKGAGVPKRQDALMGAAIGVLIAVLALGPGLGLAAAALAAIATAAVAMLAHRQIGGYTGDVLGTVEQAVEVVVLGGLAALMSTVFYV